MELVGPVESDRTGTRQRELLLISGDDLEVGIVFERHGLLRRHVIGHRLEQVFGVCLIGQSGRNSQADRQDQPQQMPLRRRVRVISGLLCSSEVPPLTTLQDLAGRDRTSFIANQASSIELKFRPSAQHAQIEET